jgi:prephenate dehydrogenase
VRLSAERFETWKGFFGSFGLEVLCLSPEEHDRKAAFTQGLTHYLGRLLAELGVGPSSIASVGYRQLLEVREQTCHDSWQLFLDLQRFNPHTPAMRDALDRALAALKARVDTP